MSLVRMNMGQKETAKKISRKVFAEGGVAGAGHPSTGDAEMTRQDFQLQGHDFVGCTKTSSHSGVESGAKTLKEIDERILELRRNTTSLYDYPHEVSMQRFNLTMGIIVILNVFVIAIETDVGYDDQGVLQAKVAWILIDTLFILAFLGEIAVRIWHERRNWIYSAWNWFDAVIVILAITDVWVVSTLTSGEGGTNLYVLSVFRIVRLVRLVRLVKLIRLLHGLYVILMAFWQAMQTMSFLLCIMLFGLMIYAIFATNLIGRNSALKDVRIAGDTVYDRFGTVYKSMYSLFELMTLEGWEIVCRPLVEAMPILFVFIVSFIMIFTFGILNMIVALVIEKTLHHTRLMSEHEMHSERMRMADELLRIKSLFDNGKEAGNGTITYREFRRALEESEEVQRIFGKMGILISEVKELYAVLDVDDSGELSVEEFLEGLEKLQAGMPSAWDSMATKGLARQIKGQVVTLNQKLDRLTAGEEAWRKSVEASLVEQRAMLKDMMAHMGIAARPSSRVFVSEDVPVQLVPSIVLRPSRPTTPAKGSACVSQAQEAASPQSRSQEASGVNLNASDVSGPVERA